MKRRNDSVPPKGAGSSERPGEPTDSLVDDFSPTMPERYRREHSPLGIQQHARIVKARGSRPIYVERFWEGAPTGPGVCVVADDTPGLLAVISTGLMLEGFDIDRADAYTRHLPRARPEAVDLFWVKRRGLGSIAAPSDEEVAAVASTFDALMRHNDARERLKAALAQLPPRFGETTIRFQEDRNVPRLTLELLSDDRPGLLAMVTDALAAEGVNILDCRIRTFGTRANDSFQVVDADGSCPTGPRLHRIQTAVLKAVDGCLVR